MNHHQYGLESIGFWQLWRPDIMVLFLVLIGIYLVIVGPFRYRFSKDFSVASKQRNIFIAGLVVGYIALGSPLAYFGHYYLFSLHMFQQSLLYIVMPPLLLIGLPIGLWQRLLEIKVLKRAFTFLAHPIISLVLFTGLFSIYHLPFIFNSLTHYSLLGILYRTAVLISAFFMWWPVVSPLPDQKSLSELRKIAYIFIGGISLTPACALIIFAKSLLYDAYIQAPLLFESHSRLDDQQLGGIVMKLVQEIVYGTALGMIFFKWFRREGKGDNIDPITPVLPKFEPGRDTI